MHYVVPRVKQVKQVNLACFLMWYKPLPKRGRNRCNSMDFHRLRAYDAHIWGEFDPHRPSKPAIGQIWSRCRPVLDQIRHKPGQVSPGIDQCRLTHTRSRPTLARNPRIVARISPNLAPMLTTFGPSSTRIRPNSTIGPESTNAPNTANFWPSSVGKMSTTRN